MRKLTIIFILSAISATGLFAQESKFYLGISTGLAIPGGKSMVNIKGGLNLGVMHAGYRFTDEIGVSVNLVSSVHEIETTDDLNVAVGYLGIGPEFYATINDFLVYELKPQVALGLLGQYSDKDGELYDEAKFKGSPGFIIANSLVFGVSKGFKLSLNFDYLRSKWKEVTLGEETLTFDELGWDDELSKISVGLGLRYNF